MFDYGFMLSFSFTAYSWKILISAVLRLLGLPFVNRRKWRNKALLVSLRLRIKWRDFAFMQFLIALFITASAKKIL